jgi:hypothetical protein
MIRLERSALKSWALLAIVVLAGAYLRLANLGDLGFRWDEDLSGLAVQAILEKGIPELPSGMIYLRGGPFLYAMAASAEVFGFSEFALRLPAAMFGILLIPVGFLFARALFDTRTGLIVAALLSISFWDIEIARYARMYAPFSLLYVLTLFALWKYRVMAESRTGAQLPCFTRCCSAARQAGGSPGSGYFHSRRARRSPHSSSTGGASWRARAICLRAMPQPTPACPRAVKPISWRACGARCPTCPCSPVSSSAPRALPRC